MRPELRELITHRELADEHDLRDTVMLCAQAVQSHWRATHERFDAGDEQDQEFVEALSDQNFRTAYEVQFIWHLGLWRLLAQFEGLLSQWFPELASRRITDKLAHLRRAWGVPSAETTRELSDWMDLRNTFSHRPTTAPTFAHHLQTSDLEELLGRIEEVLDGLRAHAAGPVSGC
jgi:hypothetical protein